MKVELHLQPKIGSEEIFKYKTSLFDMSEKINRQLPDLLLKLNMKILERGGT